MPAPFYNAIKSAVSGTPGTGAFTPATAPSGYRAWSIVPAGWIGIVRYEDGSAWELTWSYWNGTTLSRSSTQLFDSSTGSALSLTSSATAMMIADASSLQSHLGTTPIAWWRAIPSNGAVTSLVGLSAWTTTGTAAGVALATTNYLTEQPRVQITSATTASAQAGLSSAIGQVVVSTTATRGGFEMVTRWGATTLPTGPRLFIGASSTSMVSATEPSAIVGNVAGFAKDSTDTNIQLLVNSNAGSGTKTDTGLVWTANGWYETSVWCEPGSSKVYGLIVRLDTGDIWYGSTTTDVPTGIMNAYALGSLNATNTGTAVVMQLGSVTIRVSD